SSERAEPDRATAVFVEQRNHEVAVNFVESVVIDSQHEKRFLRDAARNAARRAHFCEIPRAPKQPVCNTRRSPATARNLFCSTFVHFDGQNFCRAMKDDQQIFGLIEIKAVNNAKARAKRCSDESRARRRANKGEMIQMERMNAGTRSLAD